MNESDSKESGRQKVEDLTRKASDAEKLKNEMTKRYLRAPNDELKEELAKAMDEWQEAVLERDAAMREWKEANQL